MTGRERLPPRRPSQTVVAEWHGHALAVTGGFDPRSGRLAEAFASGPRFGSDLQALVDDACVVISLALQHGATVPELSRSIGTVPAWGEGGPVERPASVVGAILEALRQMEADLAHEG